MKLKIQEIADLKEGRKSLTQIQKDGNYPKYLHRQIRDGLKTSRNHNQNLILGLEKLKKRLTKEILDAGVPVKLWEDTDPSDPPIINTILSYDKNDFSDEINSFVELYNSLDKTLNDTRNMERVMKRLNDQIDLIFDMKNLDDEQKRSFTATMYTCYTRMINEDWKRHRMETLELNEKYNSDEGNKKLISQRIKKFEKAYPKMINNMGKTVEKYDLTDQYPWISKIFDDPYYKKND